MSQIFDASPNEPGLLARTIRSLVLRHWYWMILIAGVSGGVAYFWATTNRQISAKVSGALVYRGLPPAFSSVYAPMGVAGCVEYARSVKMMKALTEALAKERRPLPIGPQQLARCFEIHSPGHGSNMIEVDFTWGDVEDGIQISNKFMDEFIRGINEQRQKVLSHQFLTIKALAEVEQGDVHATRESYENALTRATRDQRSPDQLPRADLLKQLSNADTALVDARSSRAGVLKQIDACDLELRSLREDDVRVTGELRDNLIEEALAALNDAMKPLTPKPSRTKGQERLQKELGALKRQKVDTGTFSRWVTELNDRIQGADDFLPASAIKKIHDDVLGTVDYDVEPIVTLKNEMEAVEDRKKQLKLSLAPIESKIDLLSKREDALRESLKSAKSVVTSQGDESAIALLENQHQYDEAIRRHRNLAIQQETLDYLMKSTPGGSSVWSEWDVAVYASKDTAVVSSNAKKLFALTFALCASLLSMPLFLLELTRNMDSPQKVFAHRAGVPLLAERSLNATVADPLPPTDEAVRMIALKIQQARQRGGAVVLFSSLDEEGIAVPVISSVARCLALRGEKVLLVDAVCPERNTHKLSHMMLPLDVSPAGEEDPVAASDSSESGLSDLLHSGEVEMELIRRSETPGIDVVDRGSMPFPPEAMASGALSRFFESQRHKYSIVLAHGPGACSPADMEMLAARSDTVVLVASKNVMGSRTARAVVHDMLEIGAPVLGVISV